jgi:hypothetical protein
MKQKATQKPPAQIPRAALPIGPASETKVARIRVISKRPTTFEAAMPVFRLFAPNEEPCIIHQGEERERILVLKMRAQLAISLALAQMLCPLFPDGRTPVFPREPEPRPSARGHLAKVLRMAWA